MVFAKEYLILRKPKKYIYVYHFLVLLALYIYINCPFNGFGEVQQADLDWLDQPRLLLHFRDCTVEVFRILGIKGVNLYIYIYIYLYMYIYNIYIYITHIYIHTYVSLGKGGG